MNQSQILDHKIRTIVARERESLAQLIIELKNLDAIHGYIELGFDSMFEYLTKGVGYSNGSAQRRIDALRLAKDVPSLPSMFESGAVEFHHVTTLSMAVRQVRKKRKVSAKEKLAVLEQIANRTEASTQQAVASYFDLDVLHKTKRIVQKDESVRIELVLSKAEAELIEQAQALVSHAVPTKDLTAFLLYTAERIIKEKTRVPAAKKSKAEGVESDSTTTMEVAAPESTTTVVVETSQSAKPISASVHRIVRSKQLKCVQCGSLWFPQTDHLISRWAGGTNEIENLQTLCGPCNRAKYRAERGKAAQ